MTNLKTLRIENTRHGMSMLIDALVGLKPTGTPTSRTRKLGYFETDITAEEQHRHAEHLTHLSIEGVDLHHNDYQRILEFVQESPTLLDLNLWDHRVSSHENELLESYYPLLTILSQSKTLRSVRFRDSLENIDFFFQDLDKRLLDILTNKNHAVSSLKTGESGVNSSDVQHRLDLNYFGLGALERCHRACTKDEFRIFIIAAIEKEENDEAGWDGCTDRRRVLPCVYRLLRDYPQFVSFLDPSDRPRLSPIGFLL